ncbi:MAG: hypothetical protein RXQ78_06380 [Sulfolobaceae archaeon]
MVIKVDREDKDGNYFFISPQLLCMSLTAFKSLNAIMGSIGTSLSLSTALIDDYG